MTINETPSETLLHIKMYGYVCCSNLTISVLANMSPSKTIIIPCTLVSQHRLLNGRIRTRTTPPLMN